MLTAKGKVERVTGEYLVDHPELSHRYVLSYARLHYATFMEVLEMRHLTPEQVGVTDKERQLLIN